jgi:hypothetical protein
VSQTRLKQRGRNPLRAVFPELLQHAGRRRGTVLVWDRHRCQRTDGPVGRVTVQRMSQPIRWGVRAKAQPMRQASVTGLEVPQVVAENDPEGFAASIVFQSVAVCEPAAKAAKVSWCPVLEAARGAPTVMKCTKHRCPASWGDVPGKPAQCLMAFVCLLEGALVIRKALQAATDGREGGARGLGLQLSGEPGLYVRALPLPGRRWSG